MRILITNDDGYNSEGIIMLAKILEKKYEIFVVAPLTQQSACSHSITLHNRVLVEKAKLNDSTMKIYSVSGTPADCVRVGQAIMSHNVDMVISGINHGYNVGSDVIYSGTVSAAVEASILGIPSIAFSMGNEFSSQNIDQVEEYVLRIVDEFIGKYKNGKIIVNVNFPNVHKDEIVGIKVCELGEVDYRNTLIMEGELEKYLVNIYESDMIRDEVKNFEKDIYYVEAGYVTITPLVYDLTNRGLIEEFKVILEK